MQLELAASDLCSITDEIVFWLEAEGGSPHKVSTMLRENVQMIPVPIFEEGKVFYP